MKVTIVWPHRDYWSGMFIGFLYGALFMVVLKLCGVLQ